MTGVQFDFIIICIDNLGEPFLNEKQKGDKYDIFDRVDDRYGAYVFVDENVRALYVGQSHTQTVKERIKQYYRRSSGATFQKNWCKNNNGNFDAFKNALCRWKLITISSRVPGHPLISVLESVLIAALNPDHNGDI